MKQYTFGIRDTPRGAVAWMKTPSGRKQEKQFRNGYAGARITAQQWIDGQISVIREMETIEGLPESSVVQTQKRGRPATERGAYNPHPARQFGRISDDDWNELKAAAEAAGQSMVVWALPTLLNKARREARRRDNRND